MTASLLRCPFKINPLLIGLWGLAFFLSTGQRGYAVDLSEHIQLHGFLTQGYFLTSDNKMFGSSDTGGSFGFTEAGLNASWRPTSDLRLAAQGLFRRAGTGHEHDIEVDFGLIDYTMLSTADYLLGIRLGRSKNPFGFYNETRDVLFTRPSILLPQSIYMERTRDLSLSADGGVLYGDYRSDIGNFSLEIGTGFPRADNPDTELAYLGADYPGETESKLSYIGRLAYEQGGGKYRAAISSAWVNIRYEPALFPPDDLPVLKDIFVPLVFSAQYNGEQLSLTAEYAVRRIRETSPDVPLDWDVTGISYYLQALYRFDERWQAVVRYDALYNNRKDKTGKRYQALTGRPAYTQFAEDWAVGIRYNITPSFLLAAEYHYVDGTAWLPRQDNPDPNDSTRRWHIFSLATSFRF